MGLPSTWPPKSSTAICAAVTEPCPVGVEAGPLRSVRTPILTTLSEIGAPAGAEKSDSANAAQKILVSAMQVLPVGRFAHCWSLARHSSITQIVPSYETISREIASLAELSLAKQASCVCLKGTLCRETIGKYRHTEPPRP